jgi:hypothetical protein
MDIAYILENMNVECGIRNTPKYTDNLSLDDLDADWYSEKPTDQEFHEAATNYFNKKNRIDYITKRREAMPQVEELIEDLYQAMDLGKLPKDNAFYEKIRLAYERFPDLDA